MAVRNLAINPAPLSWPSLSSRHPPVPSSTESAAFVLHHTAKEAQPRLPRTYSSFTSDPHRYKTSSERISAQEMAFKNLVILAVLVSMMIGSAMPISYPTTRLSIRGTEQASSLSNGAEQAATASSGGQTKTDDSSTEMPKTQPEPPKTTPLDDRAPTESDESLHNAASKTQKPESPAGSSLSSNNNTSTVQEAFKPSKPTNTASSYLQSIKLQLVAYWSAICFFSLIA
ncbi:hypothetical protein PGT21_007581 [Puccinia graminis f. sp. tritici]|uniref:Uncharacterized protein n=1 Tax=Puccinia graminis f. sp. tritici TaxID=56615 RepID=A0A5B0NFS6_PUCGR|nr:hypothetical protein PGT21_007581 [Puccinia graminis f. sp. tritici]